MSTSHTSSVLEEHALQVVRQAISKRNEMHRKLDVETRCEEKEIRWEGGLPF